MTEAGVLLNKEGFPIYWHLPEGRSSGHIPDSKTLWDVIWSNKETVSGFAHTHPGDGIVVASQTDMTTFAAIEAALGRRLDWWITHTGPKGATPHVVLYQWRGPHPAHYVGDILWTEAFPWVQRLRELSNKGG